MFTSFISENPIDFIKEYQRGRATIMLHNKQKFHIKTLKPETIDLKYIKQICLITLLLQKYPSHEKINEWNRTRWKANSAVLSDLWISTIYIDMIHTGLKNSPEKTLRLEPQSWEQRTNGRCQVRVTWRCCQCFHRKLWLSLTRTACKMSHTNWSCTLYEK